MAQFDQVLRPTEEGVLSVNGHHGHSVWTIRQQVNHGHPFLRDLSEGALAERRRVPKHNHPTDPMEDVAPDKGLRSQVVIRHMNGQRQVVSRRGAADCHRGCSMGDGQVPRND